MYGLVCMKTPETSKVIKSLGRILIGIFSVLLSDESQEMSRNILNSKVSHAFDKPQHKTAFAKMKMKQNNIRKACRGGGSTRTHNLCFEIEQK